MIINQTVKGSGVDIPNVSTPYSLDFSQLSNNPFDTPLGDYLYYYSWAYKNINQVSLYVTETNGNYQFAGFLSHTPISSSSDITFTGNITGDHALDNAFSYTTSFTNGVIDMNDAVDIYGDYVFSYAFANSAVRTVYLPTGNYNGNYIFNYAFYNCTNITTIEIGCPYIDGSKVFNHAFDGCASLTDVFMPNLLQDQFINESISQDIFDDMFVGCNGVTLHLPQQVGAASPIWLLEADYDEMTGGTNISFVFDQDNGEEMPEPEEPDEPMEE